MAKQAGREAEGAGARGELPAAAGRRAHFLAPPFAIRAQSLQR
jgi:hypothetical protein